MLSCVALPAKAKTFHSFSGTQLRRSHPMFSNTWYRSRYFRPGVLTLNPTSLSFGNVQAGNSASLNVTVKNTGTATLSISKASISGTGFSLSGLTVPASLSAGHSITFTVKFAPSQAGSVSGNLAVVSSSSSANISLSGTGAAAGKLALSPSALNFGSVSVGSTKSLTSNVTASGSSVVISSAGTNSGEFVLSAGALPMTLASGKSAQVTVTFRPQSSGSATGSFSFNSNASNSTLTGSLSGSGSVVSSPQPQHSVSLTWGESSSGIAGYNIYRSTVSGGSYTRINATVNGGTAYTDSSVASGQTYYYVATSVSTAGLESKYSSQIKVTIPTP